MATFTGTAGNDTITPLLISVGVVANPLGSFPTNAADVISGGLGDDSLDGGGGADSISGGGGLDTVLGGAGNDTIDVLSGGNFNGGADNDLFEVSSAAAGTVITGGSGSDTLEAQGTQNLTAATLSQLEVLALDSADLTLTAAQLVQFFTIEADGSATVGDLVIASGSNFAVTDVIELTTLNVTGAAAADNLQFTTSGVVKTNIFVNSGNGADDIVTGDGNDTLDLGAANDTGSGGEGDDSILGGAGADSLIGGGGNDTLLGGDALIDTLAGGLGNDSLNGGGGADVVSGGAGNDTITVTTGGTYDGDEDNDLFLVTSAAAGTIINGDLGTDTFEAQGTLNISAATITNFENLALDAAVLTLTNAQLIDFNTIEADSTATTGVIQLTGGTAGSVTNVIELATLIITGTANGDGLTLSSVVTEMEIDGAGGDDTISTGSVDDTIIGGEGNDSISGNGGNDSLLGGNGLDTLNGGTGNDTLDGGAGVDDLNGDGGDDSIRTAAGDVANGGTGNDTIWVNGTGTYDGDEDDDRFLVFSAAAGTSIIGDLGTDTLAAQFVIDITGASISGVENLALDSLALTLSASQLVGFTTIVADGSATTGVLTLSGGSNFAITTVTELQSLTVNGSNDAESLLFSTSGAVVTNITYDGNQGDDTVTTGGGNDSLIGNQGNDVLSGGAGNDTLDGGDDNDSLSGGSGNDLLLGDDAGIDTLTGGIGNDTIRMGEDDVVDAGDDDDTIEVFGSLFGPMTVEGGLGIDRLDPQFAIVFGSSVVFSGIEELALDASQLTLTAAQLNSFETIVSDVGAPAGNIVISLAGFASLDVTELTTLTVTGGLGVDNLAFATPGPVLTDIVVNAGSSGDTIRTGGGDDTINGEDGADFLDAGTGADSVSGGAGNDTIEIGDGGTARGDADDDILRISDDTSLATVFDGGTGLDTFDAQGAVTLGALTSFISVEQLALDTSLLTLSTTQLESFATIVSDSGSTTGNVALSAGGVASLNVTIPTLNITGSTGDDTLTFFHGGGPTAEIIVAAGDGNDFVSTFDSNDTLDGGAGNDTLDGNGGIDSLTGGAGNDTIQIEDGGSAFGGDNDDTLQLSGTNTTLATVFDGGGGIDVFDAQGTQTLGALTSFVSVERLALDALTLTLSAAQLESFTTIVSDSGATTGRLALSAGGTATTQVTGLTTLELTGSTGADLLTFTSSGATPTAINAALGDGADSFSGGNAGDTVLGEGGNDTLLGNLGADSLDGGTNNDRLEGGNGNDVLLGGGGNDTMIGGEGSDTLTGGAGTDSAQGGNGNDRYTVDSVTDIVDESGSTGNDLVNSSVSFTLGVSATVLGDVEDLTLTGAGNITGTGNALANTIRGNTGANTLTGLEGNDRLLGNAGADTLVGGLGADTLTGGADADIFFLFNPGEGVDRITDFVSGTDLIQIDDFGFAGLSLGALNASNFIAKVGAASTNPAGLAQVIYDTSNGNLWYDADGVGGVGGVRFAQLAGAPAILASDLEVI